MAVSSPGPAGPSALARWWASLTEIDRVVLTGASFVFPALALLLVVAVLTASS